MRQTSLRRYRDKLLFVLAYGAVIGAVLFAHPFRHDAPPEAHASIDAAAR